MAVCATAAFLHAPPEMQSLSKKELDVRTCQAAAEAEGDLFDEARPDPESRQSGAAPASELEDEVQARLDHFFGRDETLSQEDLFLKKFIANKVHSSIHLRAYIPQPAASRHMIRDDLTKSTHVGHKAHSVSDSLLLHSA